MKERLEAADFIKCVCIVLMVIFHLAYIGDKYPLVKQFVYTFHMPAFLVLSGYFLNVRKPAKDFLRSMWWLFVPYAVFETGYVAAASFLPTRDAVDQLSGTLILQKLFLDPLGPYWYLHTLIIASVIVYTATRCLKKIKDDFSRSLLVTVLLAATAHFTGLMSVTNVLYYAFGYALARMSVPLNIFIRPSCWALLPLLLLLADPVHFDKNTLSGVTIVYLVMSLLLAVYSRLPERVQRGSSFIGQNTLPILVFSPIFTMGAKLLLPLFAFDATGLLFLVVATSVTLLGCLFLTWLLDRLHLSRYFWGRERFLR